MQPPQPAVRILEDTPDKDSGQGKTRSAPLLTPEEILSIAFNTSNLDTRAAMEFAMLAQGIAQVADLNRTLQRVFGVEKER